MKLMARNRHYDCESFEVYIAYGKTIEEEKERIKNIL